MVTIIEIVCLFVEAYILGIGLIAIGIHGLGIKNEYSIRIQSNSGEADGLISTDKT
jgi:hypothetical protein